MRTIIVFCVMVVVLSKAQATHIVGGGMTYTFVNGGAGGKLYNVRLVLYRDVQSSTQLEDSVLAAVHRSDASKGLVGSLVLKRIQKNQVNFPSGGSGCTIAENFKVERGVYEAEVLMPDTSVCGYIVSWVRCCRSSGQINTADNLGATFTVTIPLPIWQNNSPRFTNDPVRFLCTKEQVDIENNATDPDGDSLVYALVQPYAGGSPANPLPYGTGGPPLVLSYPFGLINYNNGFSVGSPFGSNGQALVQDIGGLCRFVVWGPGIYSVAVEVKEYRNGIYLGAVRQDLLFAALACQANAAPSFSSASGAVSQVVQTGQTLCFPIHFTDPTDSVYLSLYGDIVDGTGGYMGPLAVAAPATGFTAASTQFCWTPPLSAARSRPYHVCAVARDNACPPRTSVVDYTINVTQSVNTVNPVTKPFIVYPNPANRFLHIQTSAVCASLHVCVYTYTGSLVTEQVLVSSDGTKFDLPMDKLSNGFYLMRVMDGERWVNQPIVVGF